MSESPMVSVVMAAYNRSNVLKYSVASLLRSTFEDWELLVVGDACTDDTEEVVRAFGDPRIHFRNRETNCGEQSGPNNDGSKWARGQYVAYLNQDDLWFPDHLEGLVAAVEAANADGGFSVALVSQGGDRWVVEGVMPEGWYDPKYGKGAAASLWLIRRDVVMELDGWRSFRETILPTSQDFLHRAWKAGKRFLAVPEATVLTVRSEYRGKAYLNRVEEDNRRLFERMCTEPGFREWIWQRWGIQQEAKAARAALDIGGAARCLVGALIRRFLLLFGVMPLHWHFFHRYRRKGGFMDSLRKEWGLPPIR